MYLVWTVCWNTTLLYQQHISAGEPDLSGMYPYCIVLYSTSPAQTVIHTMDLTKPKSSHDCYWGVICSEIIFDWTWCGSILSLVQFGVFFCSGVIVAIRKCWKVAFSCTPTVYASVKNVRQMQMINHLPIWWVWFSFLGNCSSLNIDNAPFHFQLARMKTKKNHYGSWIIAENFLETWGIFLGERKLHWASALILRVTRLNGEGCQNVVSITAR